MQKRPLVVTIEIFRKCFSSISFSRGKPGRAAILWQLRIFEYSKIPESGRSTSILSFTNAEVNLKSSRRTESPFFELIISAKGSSWARAYFFFLKNKWVKKEAFIHYYLNLSHFEAIFDVKTRQLILLIKNNGSRQIISITFNYWEVKNGRPEIEWKRRLHTFVSSSLTGWSLFVAKTARWSRWSRFQAKAGTKASSQRKLESRRSAFRSHRSTTLWLRRTTAPCPGATCMLI